MGYSYICNMEVFKDINGYEGLYKVSNKGNIKSLVKRYKGINILNKGIDKSRYSIVSLCKDKKHKTKTVHRLVAIAFIPNAENKPQINHKDGNKQNNNVNNLEFVTAKENMKHAFANGLIIRNTDKIAKQKRKVVLQINPENGDTVNKYNSAHEAARLTGFNRGNISTACRDNKIMYKYNWKYEAQRNKE